MAAFKTEPGSLFKLINVAFQTQAADLVNANPVGPIDGYHVNTASNNQSWSILAAGESGSSFYIRNEATKTYASVSCECAGAELFGSPDPYPWKIGVLEYKAQGQPQLKGPPYQLVSARNEKYLWVLQSNEDYTTIVLFPHGSECITSDKAMWYIERLAS